MHFLLNTIHKLLIKIIGYFSFFIKFSTESWLGFRLFTKKYILFLANKHILESLIDEGEAIFLFKDWELLCSLSWFTLHVNSFEEIFIAKEVFVDSVYNFVDNSSNLVAIDIGMNVAYTSLFLAGYSSISKVYSFEPVIQTFNDAQKNLKLNPLYEPKIVSHNFWLDSKDCEYDIDFFYDFKWSVGIAWAAKNYSFLKPVKQKIFCKDILDIFNDIVENNSNKNESFIFKIDCEGAEYALIERLVQSKNFSKISVLMIEWHIKWPEKILELLLKNKFKAFSFNPQSKSIWMIYAIKSE